MSTNKKYELYRYYRWGTEAAGFFSVWTVNENGEVISLGEIAFEDLPTNAVYSCPYN